MNKKNRVYQMCSELYGEKKNPATRFRRVRRFNVDANRSIRFSQQFSQTFPHAIQDSGKIIIVKKRFFAPVYSVIGANTRGARVMWQSNIVVRSLFSSLLRWRVCKIAFDDPIRTEIVKFAPSLRVRKN